MMETVLFYLHSGMLIVYGTLVSFGFAGIRFSKKDALIGFLFCFSSALAQLVVYLLFGVKVVELIYPWVAHFPLVCLLKLKYRKPLLTSIACVTSAYLCCQPAAWFGIVATSLNASQIFVLLIRMITMIITCAVVLCFFTPLLSEVLMKEDKNTLLLALIPGVYYGFDYTLGFFIGRWHPYTQVIVQFLPFFICIAYLIFGTIYFREHESATMAETKEQIIRIASDQQAKEFEIMNKNSHRIRLLRHDMRLLLNNLALLIQNDEKGKALQLISSYVSEIDSTSIIRYCKHDTINYILSAYASRCTDMNIKFDMTIELSEFNLDPLMFSSILSNALDNAINAVKELDESKRVIKLMLKNQENKTLLSIRNQYLIQPVFVNGIPVASEKGHGYGTQSIRYLTERLGGNLQFSIQNDWFVLRVVL